MCYRECTKINTILLLRGVTWEKKYIAHINEELKTEQTVKEHSENVAMLAEEYAVEKFKKIAYEGFMYAINEKD